MKSPLKILFLASEADPFIKIGGLGDVAGSLPPALKLLDPAIDIRLVLPFHGAIQRQAYDLRTEAAFEVPFHSGSIRAEALTMNYRGLPVYFIAGEPIAQDAPVYTPDAAFDAWKFTFFSIAALQLARELDWKPHILQANDWHTAVALYALRLNPGDTFQHTATILGLHNLPYMGFGAAPALDAFGIPPASDSALPAWAQHVPLPLGLLAADRIVTVSPNYAREILHPEFSSGLEDFLRLRASAISGILNGIDTQVWDPSQDLTLASQYSVADLESRVPNKTNLQIEFNLPVDPDVPIISLVSRMDPQKGVDLVPNALRQVAHLPWQAVILGTGMAELENVMHQLQEDFPDRVRAAIRFDSPLSHRIYAGSDLLLIPSRYEPCGLTQMIAMRYGCLPVARATGGLVDTIRDADTFNDGTGFLFNLPESLALANALERALSAYQDRAGWEQLQINAMHQDFSWQRSAKHYLRLYHSLSGNG